MRRPGGGAGHPAISLGNARPLPLLRLPRELAWRHPASIVLVLSARWPMVNEVVKSPRGRTSFVFGSAPVLQVNEAFSPYLIHFDYFSASGRIQLDPCLKGTPRYRREKMAAVTVMPSALGRLAGQCSRPLDEVWQICSDGRLVEEATGGSPLRARTRCHSVTRGGNYLKKKENRTLQGCRLQAPWDEASGRPSRDRAPARSASHARAPGHPHALAALLFSALRTQVDCWKINPRPWLQEYRQACADNRGCAPQDLSAFLPWKMSPERLEALRKPAPVDIPPANTS